MINTKDLAKKILTGLSDPVTQNELWLRDTLDAALEPIMAYIEQLEKDVRAFEREIENKNV